MNLNNLQEIFSIIVLTTIFSFLISFPLIKFLYKFGITRQVDSTTFLDDRKNKLGVPIMGGLIIVISVIIINLLLNPYKDNLGLLLLLGIFALSAILGGFDDVLNIYGIIRKQRPLNRTIMLIKVHKSIVTRLLLIISLPWELYKRFFFMMGSHPGKGIHAHEKILVQSIVGLSLAIGLYFFSHRENPSNIWIPLINQNIEIGILMIPFVWITVILMSNAVNLADGMDALASSQLLISFVSFLIIAVIQNDVRTAFLIATTIGGLISYIYFNIPPARFQMGDVGSLAMGTLLASVAFILQVPLLLLIISLPFALTLLSTVIQGLGRRILGVRVFSMAPLHYHLQISRNWSEEKVVMRLTLFSLFCAVFGIWVYLVSL